MKIIYCLICQSKYDEGDRCPLLLQCGHGFCKDCLSKMLSSSPDTSLPCPRCRHVSLVGNAVTALKKNFAILALIGDESVGEVSEEDEEEEEEEEDEDEGVNGFLGGEDGENAVRRLPSAPSHRSVSASCGETIEVGMHPEVKLVKRIGGEGRPGVEMWGAVLVGSGRKCRHKVAVKKVKVGEDMDVVWVQERLEELRKKAMWCRNVCAFKGVTKLGDGVLGLVMDRCEGSVKTEMQKNNGRLTLEQILRYAYSI